SRHGCPCLVSGKGARDHGAISSAIRRVLRATVIPGIHCQFARPSMGDRRGRGDRMPVIKARTRGKHVVRHITRLDRESYETLFAYAAFLAEPPEYVLNQLIDTVLARDKEFLAWREAHPDSHAPRPAARRSRTRARHVASPERSANEHATTPALAR